MKVLALLLAIMAMGPSPDRVVGHYVLEGVHEVGSELRLKPDGQFEYMLAYGAADYSATGKWRVKDDTVILDSKIPEGAPFRMLTSSAQRSPVVRVWVKGKNGKGIPNLDVVLTSAKGEATARTDEDGVAVFPDAGTPKTAVISVRVYHLDSTAFPLNSAHNDFVFEINGEAITTVPFRGEALKVKGDTLEMLYWDKSTPMVYRKQ